MVVSVSHYYQTRPKKPNTCHTDVKQLYNGKYHYNNIELINVILFIVIFSLSDTLYHSLELE